MRMRFFACAAVASVLLACGGSTTSPSGDADAGVVTNPQTLEINEIAIYQAVKIPLVAAGARVDTRSAPVIAGRQSVLRLMFRPGKGWVHKKIRAVLEITPQGGAPVRFESADDFGFVSSTDSDIDSSLNFDLPKETMTVGATYSVTVSVDGGELLARWPAEGTDTFDAKRSGALTVKIVPVRYQADGSDRLPDVSTDMLDVYRQYLHAMYPVTDVAIDVRDPYDFAEPVTGDGTGWDTLLNSVVALRATDKAPDNVYYYGLFVPHASFYKYCSRGCVAGLSGLVSSPSDPTSRASIGLGYPNEESAKTMAHEIGHAHGRPHAPCGNPMGIDRKFPYADGTIGVYGWDFAEKKLVEPWFTDVMGYCTPTWISDYTYNALYNRVAVVTGAKSIVAPGGRYRLMRVDGSGKVTVDRALDLPQAPLSETRALTVSLADGTSKAAAGHYVPYDHLPGGMLFVPETGAPIERAALAP